MDYNRPYSANIKFQVSVAMTTTTLVTIGHHADRLHPRFEVNVSNYSLPKSMIYPLKPIQIHFFPIGGGSSRED